MKYIKNGVFVLKDSLKSDLVIAFDEKIRGFISESEIPEGSNVIDAKGNYVIPGLIDIHMHGYLGADVNESTLDDIKMISEGIAKNGVTGFLPTTGAMDVKKLYSVYKMLGDAMGESKSWNGATVFGVNAEGPFLNPGNKGALDERYILEPNADFFKDFAGIIKLTTIAPEMDKDYECVKSLKEKYGIVPSIGHTLATYEQAAEAMHNGIEHVTHLFNAQTKLLHRAPGVVGAALTEDVTTELICDTFHVDKALYKMIAKAKGDKLCIITDCLSATGMPDGEYVSNGSPVFLKGIKCLLKSGTIAGSVLTLNKGVKNFFDYSGVTLPQAVKAASLTPASVIGLDKCKGSLDFGKDADIAIADKDFNISYTIKGGKTIYEA